MAHYTIGQLTNLEKSEELWEDCKICNGSGTDAVRLDIQYNLEHHCCGRCGAYGSWRIGQYNPATSWRP